MRPSSLGVLFALIGSYDMKCFKNCQRIFIPLCEDVLHSHTVMPNMLGHRTQIEASYEAQQWQYFAKTSCHEHIRHFLCLVYVPPCLSSQKHAKESEPARYVTGSDGFDSNTQAAVTASRGIDMKLLPARPASQRMIKSGVDEPLRTRAALEEITRHHSAKERPQDKERKVRTSYKPKHYANSMHAYYPEFDDYVIRELQTSPTKGTTIGKIDFQETGNRYKRYESLTRRTAKSFSYEDRISRFRRHKRYYSKTSTTEKIINQKSYVSGSVRPTKNHESKGQLSINSVNVPCRSFCEAVRINCNEFLMNFNTSWPQKMDCNHFPETYCVRDPAADSEEEQLSFGALHKSILSLQKQLKQDLESDGGVSGAVCICLVLFGICFLLVAAMCRFFAFKIDENCTKDPEEACTFIQ